MPVNHADLMCGTKDITVRIKLRKIALNNIPYNIYTLVLVFILFHVFRQGKVLKCMYSCVNVWSSRSDLLINQCTHTAHAWQQLLK